MSVVGLSNMSLPVAQGLWSACYLKHLLHEVKTIVYVVLCKLSVLCNCGSAKRSYLRKIRDKKIICLAAKFDTTHYLNLLRTKDPKQHESRYFVCWNDHIATKESY